jgi:hypothetical protein
MSTNTYNIIKLIEAWDNGHYIEVGSELSKMPKHYFIDFLIRFMENNGQKEIEILKKFID